MWRREGYYNINLFSNKKKKNFELKGKGSQKFLLTLCIPIASADGRVADRSPLFYRYIYSNNA